MSQDDLKRVMRLRPDVEVIPQTEFEKQVIEPWVTAVDREWAKSETGRPGGFIGDLYRRFSTLVGGLLAMEQVHGHQGMAVMRETDPDLLDNFSDAIHRGNYDTETRNLLLRHPKELIDYYIELSRRMKGETAGSLSSPVNVFTLDELSPQNNPYLRPAVSAI